MGEGLLVAPVALPSQGGKGRQAPSHAHVTSPRTVGTGSVGQAELSQQSFCPVGVRGGRQSPQPGGSAELGAGVGRFCPGSADRKEGDGWGSQGSRGWVSWG